MALNPFFLNGSSTEQSLIQDLINEQLKIYGIDIMYIPRKIIRSDNVFKEIQSSKFDDNFIIEAYVNNYEGYAGAGDIMTKFGVSLRDEVTLTISKERFEEFIAPILTSIYNPNLIYNDPNEVELVTRPREGDLIYFPLGQRLFEVKFVEHEKPFYQLGKTYVYELVCELFEYEDEIMDTTVDEVDELIKDVTATLYLIDYDDAQTASIKVAHATQTGYVQRIILNHDGNGYINPPTVSISTSPVGISSANARAVAITTSIGDAYSVKEVLITNTGYGYTEAPIVTFIGGGGSGAAATCLINTSGSVGIKSLTTINQGLGYFTIPTVTINPSPVGVGSTNAIIIANIKDSVSGILTFAMRNAGSGYQPEYDDLGRLISPTITVSQPSAISNNTGIGTFQDNEVITGSISGAQARVKNWNINNKQLLISIISGDFIKGESVVGAASSAVWTVKKYDDFITEDPYAQNDEIENEGIDIIDFSQDNPFGVY